VTVGSEDEGNILCQHAKNC